jgi:hypothetical protein
MSIFLKGTQIGSKSAIKYAVLVWTVWSYLDSELLREKQRGVNIELNISFLCKEHDLTQTIVRTY